MNDLKDVGEPNLDDKLSPNKEAEYLDSDTQEINKRIVDFYDQTLKQRKDVMCIAVIVMLCFGALEITIFCNWMKWNVSDVDYFVIIVISPIASITAISITLLIGVFRGFRKKDIFDTANVSGKTISPILNA